MYKKDISKPYGYICDLVALSRRPVSNLDRLTFAFRLIYFILGNHNDMRY